MALELSSLFERTMTVFAHMGAFARMHLKPTEIITVTQCQDTYVQNIHKRPTERVFPVLSLEDIRPNKKICVIRVT
jgi:predicted RNA-binding protein with RPS1 domain